MLRNWQRTLYREPFGGPFPWYFLGVGCFSFLSGVFLTLSAGPTFLLGPMNIALGSMFVLMGGSDLLPARYKASIIVPRAGSLVSVSVALVLGFSTLR